MNAPANLKYTKSDEWFDPATGFLLRSKRYTETPLGRLPTEIDYADWRDAGGVTINAGGAITALGAITASGSAADSHSAAQRGHLEPGDGAERAVVHDHPDHRDVLLERQRIAVPRCVTHQQRGRVAAEARQHDHAVARRVTRPALDRRAGLLDDAECDEIIALVRSESARLGRPIGIYPEIKHSSFHGIRFGANVIEDVLVRALHEAYGNTKDAPVFIQSFEVANLRYLNTQTEIRLVQLIDANDVNADGSMDLTPPYRQPYDFALSGDARTYADLLTNEGLDFIKTYADAVGPWKPYLVKTVADGVERTGDTTLTINDRLVEGSTGIVEAAHARGLLVHTWTFRNDASGYGFADPAAEMAYYMKLGVDGLFTDFPATGITARQSLNP